MDIYKYTRKDHAKSEMCENPVRSGIAKESLII